MAEAIGGDAVVKVADSGGTMQDISEYLTGGTLPREIDQLEATHFGDESHRFVPGLKNTTMTGEGDFDPVPDGWFDGIAGKRGVAFEYYPQGEGSGMVKYSGACNLSKYEINDSVGELGKFSVEFQVDGDVAREVAA